MKNLSLISLSEDELRLLLTAKAACKNSYNPYSGFSVGAAILLSGGRIAASTNAENAAFRPSLCAESSVIYASSGSGDRIFSKIAIIAIGKNNVPTENITAPCGVCRQTIFEFAQISGIDIEVIMSNTKMSKIVKAKISQLLPLAFGPTDLGIDVCKFQ